jgi:hypothetical protein
MYNVPAVALYHLDYVSVVLEVATFASTEQKVCAEAAGAAK